MRPKAECQKVLEEVPRFTDKEVARSIGIEVEGNKLKVKNFQKLKDIFVGSATNLWQAFHELEAVLLLERGKFKKIRTMELIQKKSR